MPALTAKACMLLAVVCALLICGCRSATPPAPAGPTAPPANPTAPAPVAAAPSAPQAQAAPSGDAGFLQGLQRVADTRVQYRYVVDEQAGEYHWWTCPRVAGQTGIKPTTMSREELKARGYRPCQVCRPDMDVPPPAPQAPEKPKPDERRRKLEQPIKVEAVNQEAANAEADKTPDAGATRAEKGAATKAAPAGGARPSPTHPVPRQAPR